MDAPTKAVIRRAKALKSALMDTFVKHMGDGSGVSIPLSAGVDSHCALFAALECGTTPLVYSFHLKDVNSRDFRIAERTAKRFNLDFIEVVLPNDVDRLIDDVRTMAAYGCRSKTDFECFWPMWYLIPEMAKDNTDVFFTGHGADSLYCMSRKAHQHFAGRYDEFRAQAFSSNKAFQQSLIRKRCDSYEMEYCPIFYNKDVLSVFKGAVDADMHKPIQKALSRLAFPDWFKQIQVYTHTSFQLGDSGISKHFERLLDTRLNTAGYKSVKGVYNSVLRSL